MALGQYQQESKKYLSISHGKVVQGTGEGKQLFSYVDGTIQAIYTKRSTFGSEVVTRWYIDLRDGAELYSLCLPYSSGVFKSIILSLAADRELTASTPVRIEPYEGRNGYTKVVVYASGAKLDWITKQLPPQETITIGGRQVKDDSKQMEFITSLVQTIQGRLNKNTQ